jgi:hypothetical protein
MAVVEGEPDRVVPDWIDPEDSDVAAAGDELALVRPVTLNLRGRALHPQELRRDLDAPSVVEGDREHALIGEEADFGRPEVLRQRGILVLGLNDLPGGCDTLH